jgi:hypothetical protein
MLYNALSGQWYQATNTAAGVFTYATGMWEPGLTVIGGIQRVP